MDFWRFLHSTLLFIAVYDVIKQYDFVSIPFHVKNSVLAFHWCIIYVSTKHGSTYTINKVWKIFPSLNSSKTPIMDSLSRALLDWYILVMCRFQNSTRCRFRCRFLLWNPMPIPMPIPTRFRFLKLLLDKWWPFTPLKVCVSISWLKYGSIFLWRCPIWR